MLLQEVIEVSKKYLKHMAVGFDNPKVKVYVEDAMDFLVKAQVKYDIIITDCSDPIGPAEGLYKKEYFQLIQSALRPDGIMSMQGKVPHSTCT